MLQSGYNNIGKIQLAFQSNTDSRNYCDTKYYDVEEIHSVLDQKTYFLKSTLHSGAHFNVFRCRSQARKNGQGCDRKGIQRKTFFQNIIMRCDDESIPDRSRPGLPTTDSGVARQSTVEIMLLLGLVKTRGEREEEGK